MEHSEQKVLSTEEKEESKPPPIGLAVSPKSPANPELEAELARQATRRAIEQGSIMPRVLTNEFAKNSPGTSVQGSFVQSSVLGGRNNMSNVSETQESREPVEVTLKTLLEAGAHFGHQTSRWNPAMAPYIYGSRNGIHIINLPKTVQAWSRAKAAVQEVAAQGGSFLFVGTKKQAQEAIMEEAVRGKSYFVADRWLGGMLTNFSTIRKSVERMKKLEEILQEEDARQKASQSLKFTKKERLMFSRELEKLTSSLGGIKEMTSLPSMLFVVDIRREEIAIKEARRLDIPVVALVDTNCDPAAVPFAIPSNDDGTRAIRLFSQAIADAILEGKKRYVPRPMEERGASDRRDSADRRDVRNARPRRGGGGRPNGAEQVAPQAETKEVEVAPVVQTPAEA